MLFLMTSFEVLAFNRRVKREAGANPARMRHCEQRARRQSETTVPRGMGRFAGSVTTCKSGDLPQDVLLRHASHEGGWC